MASTPRLAWEMTGHSSPKPAGKERNLRGSTTPYRALDITYLQAFSRGSRDSPARLKIVVSPV
jgi:hypothetical protein